MVCEDLIACHHYVGSCGNRPTLVVSGKFNRHDVVRIFGVGPDEGVQLKLFNFFVTICVTQLRN